MGSSQWMPPVEWVDKKASKLHTQQVSPEDLFPLHTFIHYCYTQVFISGCFLCYWFWTCFVYLNFYIWNIQWSRSLYVHMLHGLLSCDSSPMCKKCWLSFHSFTLLLMIWLSTFFTTQSFFIIYTRKCTTCVFTPVIHVSHVTGV